MKKLQEIGFGGGCHWCTEAVFQSLKGVYNVPQGYLNAEEDLNYSEGILLEFDATIISLKVLVAIHIRTHQSFHEHSMRDKYRSGIYVFKMDQRFEVKNDLLEIQKNYQEKIITKVYTFKNFKESREEIRNYYNQGPSRPFCTKYIKPKLHLLEKEFADHLK